MPIKTISRRSTLRTCGILFAALSLSAACFAQIGELHAPTDAIAGSPAMITSTGNGSATFYLSGPGAAAKRDVELGGQISLSAKEVQHAGRYVATICADSCKSIAFFVNAAQPASLTFLVHPSRAPVALNDVISGVALPFDEFHNLVLAPTPINFQLTANNASLLSRTVPTRDGVAWFRTNSSKNAGALQLTASVNDPELHDVASRRVVQQVASDPCNLRIKGQRNAKGIALETEPVRDCAGNPVPDGTVVTFTVNGGNEKSTVDAPIKQGVARAQISQTGPVVISAASGVVMGNELRLGAQ